jgi:hypothetical protein
MAASSLLSLISVISFIFSIYSSQTRNHHHHYPSLTLLLQTPSLRSDQDPQFHRLRFSNQSPPPQAPQTQLSLNQNPSLFPHSYGGYSISLSIGKPPQTTSFLLDTGSSLVWFPCTSRYLCFDCAFPNIDPEKTPTFIPKLSSSSKILGCKNPKCALLLQRLQPIFPKLLAGLPSVHN